MASVLMIFLDGVGIGSNDAGKNIFIKKKFMFLENVFGATPYLGKEKLIAENKFLFPTDATLGVEGIPQSGTGQTSIYCGVNGAKLIGRHFGPYVHSKLKPVLESQNIFTALINKGMNVLFANAFPQIFFDYINSGKKRLNVTTLMALYSKVKLLDVNDMIAGKGLSSDITNRRWNTKMKYDIPTITPEEAAEKLLNLSSKNHFTLFEYFFTDHLGHGRNKNEFDILLNDLDKFLYKIISELNSDSTLLICSDHGNLENIEIKGHTTNPTLTISAGNGARELKNQINDLSQIKNALLKLF